MIGFLVVTEVAEIHAKRKDVIPVLNRSITRDEQRRGNADIAALAVRIFRKRRLVKRIRFNPVADVISPEVIYHGVVILLIRIHAHRSLRRI